MLMMREHIVAEACVYIRELRQGRCYDLHQYMVICKLQSLFFERVFQLCAHFLQRGHINGICKRNCRRRIPGIKHICRNCTAQRSDLFCRKVIAFDKLFAFNRSFDRREHIRFSDTAINLECTDINAVFGRKLCRHGCGLRAAAELIDILEHNNAVRSSAAYQRKVYSLFFCSFLCARSRKNIFSCKVLFLGLSRFRYRFRRFFVFLDSNIAGLFNMLTGIADISDRAFTRHCFTFAAKYFQQHSVGVALNVICKLICCY